MDNDEFDAPVSIKWALVIGSIIIAIVAPIYKASLDPINFWVQLHRFSLSLEPTNILGLALLASMVLFWNIIFRRSRKAFRIALLVPGIAASLFFVVTAIVIFISSSEDALANAGLAIPFIVAPTSAVIFIWILAQILLRWLLKARLYLAFWGVVFLWWAGILYYVGNVMSVWGW